METIEAILSEMREFADTDSQTIGRDVLRREIQHFADRIKVAVAKMETTTPTCKESLQVGNSAAMREALEKFSAVDLSRLKFPLDGDSSAIYNSDKKEITIPYWRVAELLNEVRVAQDMAKSAIADPPRNINRINTHDDMVNAWNDYVYHHSNGRFSLASFFVWLFDEAKGEAK